MSVRIWGMTRSASLSPARRTGVTMVVEVKTERRSLVENVTRESDKSDASCNDLDFMTTNNAENEWKMDRPNRGKGKIRAKPTQNQLKAHDSNMGSTNRGCRALTSTTETITEKHHDQTANHGGTVTQQLSWTTGSPGEA